MEGRIVLPLAALQVAGGAIALVVLLLIPTVAMIWIGREIARRLQEIETVDAEPDEGEP